MTPGCGSDGAALDPYEVALLYTVSTSLISGFKLVAILTMSSSDYVHAFDMLAMLLALDCYNPD